MPVPEQPNVTPDRRRYPRRICNVRIDVRQLPQAEFQRLLEHRNSGPSPTQHAAAMVDSLAVQTQTVLNALPGDMTAAPPGLRLQIREQLQTLARSLRPEDTVAEAETVDASLSGLAFSSYTLQRAGHALELTLSSRDQGRRLTLLGVVVYCHPQPVHANERPWRVGVDFVDVRPDEHTILEQILS